MLRRLALGLAMLALACTRPAATGAASRDVSAKLDAEDLEVGRRLDAELLGEVREYADPELRAYVGGVLERVGRHAGRQIRWTARILDSSHMTIRSAPGGFVYLTRGLLAALGSESDLAAALAHEAAHVAERHWRREGDFARAHGVSRGEVSRLAPAERVELLARLREDENRADELALGYLEGAGYELQGLRRVLGLFATLERMGGKDRVPPLLRTHPRTASRIERLGRERGKGGERRQKEYLTRIDGLLFGEDPSEGYLLGQRYLNPAADVDLALPEPWRLRLIGQDLMAVLPGKATIALFARSEQGGVEATVSALTGDGPGFAAIRLGDRDAWLQVSPADEGLEAHKVVIGKASVAWVLAVVVPQGSSAPREVLDAARRIADPKLAEVKPLRIRVEPLPAETSLRELDRARPSRTDLESLALINGVEADARLPTGTLVKRVDE